MLRTAGFCVLLLLATASAQPLPPVADKDYVICENITQNVYAMTPTGVVITLYTAPTSTTITANWVAMARNNRDVLLTFFTGAPYGLSVLTPGGTVATYATTWRADNIRLLDDRRLLWNGTTVTGPALTNAAMATDDVAGTPVILVSGMPTTVLNGAENEDTGLWAFSSQGTSPAGGLTEADIAAGMIVRTLATGLAQVNTVDFNRHDGNFYATEFGSVANPASAEGAVYQVTPAGAITTIASGLALDRVNSMEVMQDGNLLIGSRHNVLIMNTAGTVLSTLPFQVNRSFPATGATVYGSNRLQLDTTGGTTPGSGVGVRVSFRAAAAANGTYVLAAALSERPGLVIGSEILDLQPDILTLLVLGGALPTVFQNFAGALDAAGDNVPPILVQIPATLPSGLNLRVFIAGVAVGGAQIVGVTETEAFTIR